MDKFPISLKYWILVVGRQAVRFAFIDPFQEFWGRVMDIAITLIIALVSVWATGYLDPSLNIGRDLSTLMYVFGVAFLLRLTFGMLYFPAKLYKELGGFDKNLLKLIVVPDCEPSDEGEGWFGLTLFNRSRDEIQECSVELSQVDKKGWRPYKFSRPQRLSWSSEEKSRQGRQDIPAGGNRRVDLAVTHREQNTMDFTLQNPARFPPYDNSPGYFHVVIIFTGVFSDAGFIRQLPLDFVYLNGSLFVSDKNGKELEPEPERKTEKTIGASGSTKSSLVGST